MSAGRLPRAMLCGAALLLGCGRDTVVNLGWDGAGGSAAEAQRLPAPAESAGEPAERPDAAVAPTPSAGAPAAPLADREDAGAREDAAVPQAPSAGATTPAPCAQGLADCDGDVANGCEVDLHTSLEHCGACGASCTQPGCVCENGTRVLRCPDGRADCDLDFANGCEADVSSDPLHCGACDRVCPSQAANANASTCEAGQRVLACVPSLLAPWGDCDGNPDNGCETALWAAPYNCGTCGTVCVFCSDGLCI